MLVMVCRDFAFSRQASIIRNELQRSEYCCAIEASVADSDLEFCLLFCKLFVDRELCRELKRLRVNSANSIQENVAIIPIMTTAQFFMRLVQSPDFLNEC